MLRNLLIAAASVAFLAACESTTSLPYQPSTQNVIAAQQSIGTSGALVSVAPFSAAPGVSKPTCRMAGQLDVAPGSDIPTYIRNAFESEIFMADLHGPNGVSIRGQVESLEVSTFGTGAWTIDLTVTSDAYPSGYRVSTTHPFASSFSAYMACQNAAIAFNPAVQALLSDVVSHPEFGRLAGVE